MLQSSLLCFLMNHGPERRSRKAIKAQFGSMLSLPTSFGVAGISLNFISRCREVRTWKNLTGIGLFSNSYRPQNHLIPAEYAGCVLSRARTAAFNANLVVFNCEAQRFRSHNAIVVIEGPTGRQLQAE